MHPGPIMDGIAAVLGLTPHSVLVIGLILAGLSAATLFVARLHRRSPQHDFSELENRLKSWWIIVALLTAALVMGRGATLLLLAFISYLALKEYLSMIPTRRQDRAVLFFVYLAIPIQYWLIWTEWYGFFIIFVPVYMFMFLGAAMVVLGHTEGFLKASGMLHWGLASTVYSLGHLAYLLVLMERGGHAVGAALVIALLVVTELNDVAQYVWGKAFGRHPIVPKVSPNKTWEGFLGGLVTTALVSVAVLPWLTPWSASAALMMGLFLALAGFFGDVTLSAVKRDMGLKDAGTLLPGHGGILDRVDSLIFTAPLFFHLTRYSYT
jgi:phosphatidate cytidylyltransferase